MGASVSAAFSRNRQNVYNTVDNKQLNFRWDDVYSKNEYSFSGAVSYRPDLYGITFCGSRISSHRNRRYLLKLNPDYLINGQHTQRAIRFVTFFGLSTATWWFIPSKGPISISSSARTGFRYSATTLTSFTWHLVSNGMCHSADGGIGEAVYPRKLSGTDGQPFINTRGLGYGREGDTGL